jgi:hypothetical protein
MYTFDSLAWAERHTVTLSRLLRWDISMLDDYRLFLLWQWIALDVEAPFRVGFSVF